MTKPRMMAKVFSSFLVATQCLTSVAMASSTPPSSFFSNARPLFNTEAISVPLDASVTAPGDPLGSTRVSSEIRHAADEAIFPRSNGPTNHWGHGDYVVRLNSLHREDEPLYNPSVRFYKLEKDGAMAFSLRCLLQNKDIWFEGDHPQSFFLITFSPIDGMEVPIGLVYGDRGTNAVDIYPIQSSDLAPFGSLEQAVQIWKGNWNRDHLHVPSPARFNSVEFDEHGMQMDFTEIPNGRAILAWKKTTTPAVEISEPALDAKSRFENILKEFVVSADELRRMIPEFQRQMKDGIEGNPDPNGLMMINSGLTVPTGKETGVYGAMDIGGSNARAMEVQLNGDGTYAILSKAAHPIPPGIMKGPALDLFNFFAAVMEQLKPSSVSLLTGVTYSYPATPVPGDLSQAIAGETSKGLTNPDLPGKNLGIEFKAANLRFWILWSIINVFCNDTVGTLIAGAYQKVGTIIGAIAGTGYNTSQLINGIIYNFESARFQGVSPVMTRFDYLLDQLSRNPNQRFMEKMVSGMYLGELVRLIVRSEAFPGGMFEGWLEKSAVLSSHERLEDSTYLSNIRSDSTEDLIVVKAELANIGIRNSTLEQQRAILKLAKAITRRSSRVLSTSFIAQLEYVDPELKQHHNIAIDGSLYEHVPGYEEDIHQAFIELVGPEKASRITVTLTKDGSGIGAAITSAVVGTMFPEKTIQMKLESIEEQLRIILSGDLISPVKGDARKLVRKAFDAVIRTKWTDNMAEQVNHLTFAIGKLISITDQQFEAMRSVHSVIIQQKVQVLRDVKIQMEMRAS